MSQMSQNVIKYRNFIFQTPKQAKNIIEFFEMSSVISKCQSKFINFYRGSIFDFSSNSFVFMIFGPVLVTVKFRKLRFIVSFNDICVDKSFRKCADQLTYIRRASCNFAAFYFIFVKNASSGVVAFAS